MTCIANFYLELGSQKYLQIPLNQTDNLNVSHWNSCKYFYIKTSKKFIRKLIIVIQNELHRFHKSGVKKTLPDRDIIWIWSHNIFSINWQIFPLAYVLMTNKTAECYTAVFNFIKNNIFDLKPAIIMTDWETGLRCAIRTCFPNSTLKGCWYHYCAALRKKVDKSWA